MSVQFFAPNEKVKLIDELSICGCGNPKMVYGLIHVVMKEILKSSSVKVDDYVGYYDYMYMIYQLNEQGFLEHGSSIYGSWVTEKGEKLIEALDEMAKYDYEYEDFFEANLVSGDTEGENTKMRKYTIVAIENEEGNTIRVERENQGFTAIELLGILDFTRNDIYKQMTDKAFAEKTIEHKRVVVDKE